MTSSLHLRFPQQLLEQIYAETNTDSEELKFSADINESVGEILVKNSNQVVKIEIKAQKDLLLTLLEDGWQCCVSSLETDCAPDTQREILKIDSLPPEMEVKDSEDSSVESGEENSEQLEKVDSGEDVLSEKEEKCSRNLRKQKTKGVKSTSLVVCPICLNSFRKQQNLKKHLQKFHDITWTTYTEAIGGSSDLKCIRVKLAEALEKTFPDVDLCCICQLPISPSGRNRSAHLRHSHNLSLEEYNLVLSMSEEERQDFLEEKSAERKESEFCHLCEKSFSTLSVHTTHVRSMHPDNKQMLLDLEKKRSAYNTSTIIMQCPLCTEKRNGKAIFRHFKDLHSQHSDYDAMLKELTEKYREQYLAHERNRYRDKLLSRTAQCKFCQEEFPHRWARARHQGKCSKNPNPTKLHHCSICMRSYTSREKLEEHLKEHPEDGRYFCEQCGKSYKHKSGLYIHLRKAHGVQMKAANFQHSCDKCDRRFFDKTSLQEHIQRKHADIRDKTCVHCGKGFRTQPDLQKHIKYVHQNNYKYRCPQCGHGMDRRSHLQTHRCGRVKRIQNDPAVLPADKPVYEDLSHSYVQEAPSYMQYQEETPPAEDPLGPSQVPSYMLLGPAMSVPTEEEPLYPQEQHFM